MFSGFETSPHLSRYFEQIPALGYFYKYGIFPSLGIFSFLILHRIVGRPDVYLASNVFPTNILSKYPRHYLSL